MSPQPSLIASGGAAADAQRAQAASSGSPLGDPRRDTLSPGAQDALALDDTMRGLLRGKYTDEDAALARLQNLDQSGQERLREDPTEIGALRPGVDPESVNTRALSVGAQGYENVTSEQRREANAHTNESLAEKMNASLQQAPMMTHHFSI